MELAAQEAVMAVDADFGAMAGDVGRHAWGLPGLTVREKAFTFIAADLCRGNLGFPLRTHVTMALSQGVSLEDIREAVRHLAPFVGYPSAAEALIQLAELGREPYPAQPASSGPAVDVRARVELPTAVRDQLSQLAPAFADFVGDQFDRRWNRPNLTVRERALCTIATDVLNGTLGESFRLHVDLALAHGAGEAQLTATLLLVAEYGMARSWQAFAALRALLRTRAAPRAAADPAAGVPTSAAHHL